MHFAVARALGLCFRMCPRDAWAALDEHWKDSLALHALKADPSMLFWDLAARQLGTDKDDAKEQVLEAIGDFGSLLNTKRGGYGPADAESKRLRYGIGEHASGDHTALEALASLLKKTIHVYVYSLGDPYWSSKDYGQSVSRNASGLLRLQLSHRGLRVLKKVKPGLQRCPC